MPNLEEVGKKMTGASVLCMLDLLQGHWKRPLDQTMQESFTVVTARGVYTPTRVPQGVRNAASYCQGTIGDDLDGLLGNIAHCEWTISGYGTVIGTS